jgi:hypothetical protein
MKKYIITIAIVLFTSSKMYGQNLKETNFFGNWKVESIEILNIGEDLGKPQQLEMMKKLFLKSKFEFKADHHINFKFGIKEMEVKNQLWRFNSSKNIITVTELKDKKSILMELKVSIENSKTYFILLETPFKLEVSKE